MDIVNEILEKQARELEKYKPITVEKHLELEFDVGSLLAFDKNDLDAKALKQKKDVYLLNLTRDNTQLLFNKIWELPTERVEEAIVAKLPAPTFVLPREKPVPKPRPLTRWQQFAKEKGIQKKKKSKLTWDEQLQKWVPLYGLKRAKAEKDKQWVIEVPGNADPMEDQFEKAAGAKSERIAKNELQRLRNIAKARNVKVPRMGLTEVSKSSAKDLAAAVTVARASTASIGKFQPKLPKEKEARGISAILPSNQKKRKQPPVPAKVERSENLAIIDSILNKQPKIDIEKAVSRQINDEQIQRSEEKRTTKPKAGRRGVSKKKNKAGKGRGLGKKPTGGKGERNVNKRNNIGRKRR